MGEDDFWTMEQFLDYYKNLIANPEGSTRYCITFYFGPQYTVGEIWSTRNAKIQLPIHTRVRIQR